MWWFLGEQEYINTKLRVNYLSVYIEVMYTQLVVRCYRLWSKEPEKELEDIKCEGYRMCVILMWGKRVYVKLTWWV
jgi:hypothetical protein